MIGQLKHSWLTHDFCPGANKYVYWLKQPMALLALAALASLSIGLFVAPQGYWACGGIVALLLLGVSWPWLGIKGLSASLSFTRRRALEASQVEAVLVVVNRWPFPVWGLTLQHGFQPTLAVSQADAADDSIALALAHVPAWSRTEFRWLFTPRCRGEYPVSAPQLSTAFPFGLYTCSRPVDVGAKLLVWPLTFPLLAPPQASGASFSLGALSEQRAGHEGDVLGTRPYRPGDSLRHLHWQLTARYGRFIVCERQSPQTSATRVIVDLTPEVHGGQGADSSLEWSIRVAASVVECLLLHHGRVEFVINGETIAASASASSLAAINDQLARWTPPTSACVARPCAERRDRVPQILITTELGLAARYSHLGDSSLVIALSAAAFAELPALAEPLQEHADIWLADPIHVACDLRQQWERACRHAWQKAG